jgi:hypothetical protein
MLGSPKMMKTITPIVADETLLASGVYVYFLNEQPTGVTEPWSIHRLPDSSYCTRVERDARAAFGMTILVEAFSRTWLATDDLQRFTVAQSNANHAATSEGRAEYLFSNKTVIVTRSVNSQVMPSEELSLPENTVVSPLMRVFLGPVIRQVLAHGKGQPVPVLVPSLEQMLDPETLLRPLFDARQAAMLGAENVEVDGRLLPARRYQYLSKHYDAESQFWLDENDLLLRYRFVQSSEQVWDTRLTTYRQFA